MTRLILWRHGRTEWNLIGRFQGQLDVDLDDVGIAQAEEASHRVALYEPDVIVSSDLRRATRTAEVLSELVGKEVSYDARLRERFFGTWQGLTMAEIQEKYPEDADRWARYEEISEPTVEPLPVVVSRVTDVLREVAVRVGSGGIAVLVTHGGAARAGCAGLLGWPEAVWGSLAVLGNCQVTELGYSSKLGWQLRSHNAA
jgi:glucosyl-3-phosphoglycerate phosphatase